MPSTTKRTATKTAGQNKKPNPFPMSEHGNSNKNNKPHHLYEIRDSVDMCSSTESAMIL